MPKQHFRPVLCQCVNEKMFSDVLRACLQARVDHVISVCFSLALGDCDSLCGHRRRRSADSAGGDDGRVRASQPQTEE